MEGLALAELAATYHSMGESQRAVDSGRAALEMHKITGRRLAEGRTIMLLGSVFHSNGDSMSAEIHWSRALAILVALQVPDAEDARLLLRMIKEKGIL